MARNTLSRTFAVAAALALTTALAACSGSTSENAATTEAPATASSSNSQSATTPDTTTPAAAELVVIDVRTPEEFAAGHLEGAINIDLNGADFAEAIAGLDKSASYAVYCRSGNRSGQAMSYMQSQGFENVVNVGGYEAASAELGLPIVTD